MKDFSYKIYGHLLDELVNSGYHFITFEEYCKKVIPQKFCILRHDVDRLPLNAVVMAKIEKEKNIKASYYFRVAKEAYNEQVINDIVSLGHEAGYHYEDMDLTRGNIDDAYQSYLKNLAHFRKFYPIATICMHGSPMSRFDNKDVWKKYQYKVDGILGEPYFDIDYDSLYYITDTGRHWNNSEISVRDKVKTKFKFDIHGTIDIVRLVNQKKLPNQLMINTHPHRWFDALGPWTKELMLQSIKNIVKSAIIKIRNN